MVLSASPDVIELGLRGPGKSGFYVPNLQLSRRTRYFTSSLLPPVTVEVGELSLLVAEGGCVD